MPTSASEHFVTGISLTLVCPVYVCMRTIKCHVKKSHGALLSFYNKPHKPSTPHSCDVGASGAWWCSCRGRVCAAALNTGAPRFRIPEIRLALSWGRGTLMVFVDGDLVMERSLPISSPRYYYQANALVQADDDDDDGLFPCDVKGWETRVASPTVRSATVERVSCQSGP